jgi:branched-chain amino acid transport system substrate-binding protein
MSRTTLALLAAVALFVVALGGAKAEVKVAVVGPLTGTDAAFGEQLKRGAEMAVADLNAGGGVLDEELLAIVEDDACDPERAVAAAEKVVSEGAGLVVGHFCSGASIPASAVYAAAGILQISPGSTNPALTDEATEKGWQNVHRVCGRDDLQGKVAGKYLAVRFRDKRVAIVHDQTAYGQGLAEQTKRSMNEAGLKEALFETYSPGQEDFSQLLLTMKSLAVKAFYIGGYYSEAARMIRQAHALDYRPQLVSGDALVTAEFWNVAGPAGEGAVMTFQPDPRFVPEARLVVERFREQGYEPEGYTLYAYAAVQVWAEAARNAESFDMLAVSQQIRGASFDTVIGKLSFDEKGDVKNASYVWYIWEDGNYAELAPR